MPYIIHINYVGMTDTMGRMHSDAQFAGSSSVNFVFLLLARQSKQVFFALTRASVPAHVEMMGFLGIGQVMCK